MSEENRTLTSQFVELGDVHHLGESGSDGEEILRSQLLDRRMASSEIGRKMNVIVAPLSTQLEALIQSVRELNERNSTRWTEGNVTSERSRSWGQHYDRSLGLLSSVVFVWFKDSPGRKVDLLLQSQIVKIWMNFQVCFHTDKKLFIIHLRFFLGFQGIFGSFCVPLKFHFFSLEKVFHASMWFVITFKRTSNFLYAGVLFKFLPGFFGSFGVAASKNYH